MVKLTSLAIHCLAFALCGMVAHGQEISSTMTGQKIQLAVHGGAGTIERSKMTPEKDKEYRTGLENALRAGREIFFYPGSLGRVPENKSGRGSWRGWEQKIYYLGCGTPRNRRRGGTRLAGKSCRCDLDWGNDQQTTGSSR